MKKALMNASVASMIYQFNMNNIDILEELGYQVDVACNFGKENPMKDTEIAKFKKNLMDRGIKVIETDCPRSPLAFRKLVSTYKQLKNLADSEVYDLIHTQSPIGGALCRLAFRKARKKGTKVIYTAHGFHFYKGAPLKNWFIYYPIEKICSHMTDILITINKEDYELAQQKMKAKKVEYVPGIGIDLDKFRPLQLEQKEIRKKLGIPEDAIWMLSVGELSKRKNHEILIKAMGKFKNLYCTIAGQGELKEKLINLSESLGVGERVKLLGFRTDISELCEAADIFGFPSLQEGLPVALMEAMASGLPVVCSRIRGNIDLVNEGKGGEFFEPNSLAELEQAITRLLAKNLKDVGAYNREKIRQFDIQLVKKKMQMCYCCMIEK